MIFPAGRCPPTAFMFMVVWMGSGMRIESNARQVSPEEAVVRLRKLIGRHGRPAGISKFLLLGLKVLVVTSVLYFVAGLVIGIGLGQPMAALAAIIGGTMLYAWRAYRKETGAMSKEIQTPGSILVGNAFQHFTEPSGAGLSPIEVGESGMISIEYLKEPNPHVLMIGSTSSGKTTTLRSFIARVAVANKVPFLVIDWNGENEAWAADAGASFWKVPDHFKINLFKLNGMSKESRASTAVESLAIAARLTSLQSTKVKSALLKFYLGGKEPSLFDLWSSICSKSGKENVLNQRLRAIQRVIGTEPDAFW